MKLIDKDVLVAKIERRIKQFVNENNTFLKNSDNAKELCSRIIMCKEVLSFIDTLEVKEVDLEKELSYVDYAGFFKKHPNFSDDWGFDESWVFAEYFFKLGLKA